MIIAANVCDKNSAVALVIIDEIIRACLYPGILIAYPPVAVFTDVWCIAAGAVAAVFAVSSVSG